MRMHMYRAVVSVIKHSLTCQLASTNLFQVYCANMRSMKTIVQWNQSQVVAILYPSSCKCIPTLNILFPVVRTHLKQTALLLCPVILLTLSGVKLWRKLKTEMLNKRHQQMSCALSSSFSCNFNTSLQHDNIQPVQKKYKRRGVQMPHSWPLLLLKCP